jgi:hypothetical protein
MWRRGREVGRNSAMYRFVLVLAIGPTISHLPHPHSAPLVHFSLTYRGHTNLACANCGQAWGQISILEHAEWGLDNLIAASCDSDSLNHTGRPKGIVSIIFINHYQDGFLYASPFLLPRLNNDAGRRIGFRHVLEEVRR